MKGTMSELTVENKNGQLVVDSRLIAKELGIEHKNLLSTLDSYLTELEFAFGSVTFETATRKDNNKGGNQPKVAYLTEEQATFLMTLSRNSEQVVQAKIHLVKAFSKAKQALSTISPELIQMLNTMTEKMNILTARTERLDAIDKATEQHKGIGGIVENEVEDTYPDDIAYTVREYLDAKGVSNIHLHTMRKRAVMFASQGKQNKLPKKGKEYLFIGNDISYLDQALKTTLELD